MAGKHIFISYRSTEFDIAYKLAQSLAHAGYPIWMDKLGGILPGMDWQKALEDGVDEAFAMVALLSRNYLSSIWCEREYKRADIKHIPIIPSCIGKLDGVNLPMALQTLQYADLTDEAIYDIEVAKLLKGIEARTNIQPSTPKSLPVINANPYRDDPEDKMTNVENELGLSKQVTGLDELKAIELDELSKDIAFVKEQYIALRSQYRLVGDGDEKVRLEGKITARNNEFIKLSQKRDLLKSES